MANTVVLGYLSSLYGYDDCLRMLGGVGSYLQVPSFTISPTNSLTARLSLRDFGVGDYSIILDDRNISDGLVFIENNKISIQGGIRVDIDGVEVFNGTTYSDSEEHLFRFYTHVGREHTFTNIMCRNDQTVGVRGCVRLVEYVGLFRYIINGDFGDTETVLVDSSGNGNNGLFFGASWWKRDVNQNFATPQLFKDTLTTPLTEDQYVIYTDATPYYGSNDPFWNPYNQDPTFSFTVVQQKNILQKLLQFGVFDMKPVTKTIIGTDIAGSGIEYLDFAVDHAKILTTGTAGTLSVQFPEDPVGTFRTIEVTNDGIFIPVGQFTAIDRDASTVVFDNTLLLGA